MDKSTGFAAIAGASAIALGIGYWLGARSAEPTPPSKSEVGSGGGAIQVTAIDTTDRSTATHSSIGVGSPLNSKYLPKRESKSSDTTAFVRQSSIDQKQQRVVVDATDRLPNTVRAGTHEAVAPEVEGDVFDRARVMVGWNQPLMEKQVALVLGVGGIGSSVCFALARLGIKKMYILDRDAVDASNLNRQMLFGVSDVGKRKVLAGLETLKSYHNLRTEIIPMDMDAVPNWSKIVAVASECTVIFNNIDYGACFDLAASALAKHLKIPYLAASTYSFNVEMTLCKGGINDSCFTCTASIADSFGHWELKELKEWIKFETGSDSGVISATQIDQYLSSPTAKGGRRMVQMDVKYVQSVLDSINRSGGVTGEEFVKLFAPAWKANVIARLVPSRITSYESINFIPRDPAFPTRTVGSWICVCVGGSLLLVNKWVQHLMRPYQTGVKPIHTWTKFNIGMEEGAYTVDSALNAIDKFCALCKDVQLSSPQPPVPVATVAAASASAADIKSNSK